MRRGRGEGGVGRKGKGSAQREERRIRFEFAIPCAFSKIREGRRKEGRRFKTRRSIGTSRYRVSPCRRSPYHFPASSLIETRTIDLPSKTEKKKKIKREMSGEHARIAITRRKRSFASEKILPNSNSNSSNSSGDDDSGGVVVVVVVVHTRLVHDRIARERNIGRVLHSVWSIHGR